MSKHKPRASCVLIRAVAMLGAKWHEALRVMTFSAVLSWMGHCVYFDVSVWGLMGPSDCLCAQPRIVHLSN
jgi:hypothetical protein